MSYSILAYRILLEESDDANYGPVPYEEKVLRRPYKRRDQKNFMTQEYIPVAGEGHKVRKKDRRWWKKIYEETN